jgi:hypothetical protein
MTAKDYELMAEEYFQTAEALTKVIHKYEDMLKNPQGINLEYVNSKIAYFGSLKNYATNTGNNLRAKAVKLSNN